MLPLDPKTEMGPLISAEQLAVVERYVGIGVGKRWSRAFMKMAADRTGGAVDQPNPVEIQRAAQVNPLDKVIAGWTTGTDPATHIGAVQAELKRQGARIQ
mgnify:CR=1 FL=1